MKCPGCDGEPMMAYGKNRETGAMDVREPIDHLCPTRADTLDYEFCRCCDACMKAGICCRRERSA